MKRRKQNERVARENGRRKREKIRDNDKTMNGKKRKEWDRESKMIIIERMRAENRMKEWRVRELKREKMKQWR